MNNKIAIRATIESILCMVELRTGFLQKRIEVINVIRIQALNIFSYRFFFEYTR